MAREFFIPKKILSGDDAFDLLSEFVSDFGKKALIVTGKNVRKLPCFASLCDMLTKKTLPFAVFDGITGEPDDIMIESGAEIYRKENCDFLIAIGGGSPIDSMKAIAVNVTGEKNICDYYGEIINLKLPKMIAIPTTAGTGSEATQFTVINDTKRDIKMLLKGSALVPDIAVVDGKLGISAPQTVTASTGLDALTHAVEAYTSRRAQPLTDGFCISAVKRLFEFLPRAFKDGNDLKARKETAIAALEGGIAINNSSVTIVHGMSRPIGALYHVPHGLSNAMLLYKCMSFAKEGALSRFADLARTIGVALPDTDDRTAADLFLDALGELCKTLEVPNLKEYGIQKQDFFKNIDKMADDAIASGSPANTVKEVKKADIVNIYRSMFD
ncbi:MAG: iron-containing alcohol dehydrogenase [Acutalibacteraceae bacterium]|nr:iron-containing alcohol dehydrogenase [Acutalibacteraceae bacterium]